MRQIYKLKAPNLFEMDENRQTFTISFSSIILSVTYFGGVVSAENDFERLKEMYYKECRPINEEFVRKFQRRNDTRDYE